MDRQAVLLTKNAKHFYLLQQAWRLWSIPDWGLHKRHPGIIVLPGEMLASQWRHEIQRLIKAFQPFDNELLRWRASEGWSKLPCP